MECSIRLLRLKGSMTTFSKICASIQHLTNRTFTYGHLAQLKFILPEAVSIKKVLIRDEATCCMKPELQVNLHIGTTEDSVKRKEESDHSLLRRVFKERLVDLSKKHPRKILDLEKDQEIGSIGNGNPHHEGIKTTGIKKASSEDLAELVARERRPNLLVIGLQEVPKNNVDKEKRIIYLCGSDCMDK